MKNLKNKKILFILVAFLFCLFVFSGSSKATIDVISNDKNYKLPDLPEDMPYSNYFIIGSGSTFNLYNFNGDIAFLHDYPTTGKNSFKLLDSVGFATYVTNPLNSHPDANWSFSHDYTQGDVHTRSDIFDIYCFSNVDIYGDLNKETIVFPKAPTIAEAVEIPTITEAQQIPEIIAKVVKMIIPVCLTILATLLLISLIQSVIYRIQ